MTARARHITSPVEFCAWPPPSAAKPPLRRKQRPPAWLALFVFTCTTALFAVITPLAMKRARPPLAARYAPPVDLGEHLECPRGCDPPTYCDARTGKCVADALAVNPDLRRHGAKDKP
jgi:hypothetical protein